MNTQFARRLASNIRAALVIVAFTALAAVGFAAAHHAERVSTPKSRAAAAAAPATHVDLLVAPAAAPMSATAFSPRF